MPLPTAEIITNLYLYGSQNKPSNLLDPAIANRTGTSTITVDLQDYMTNGAGRFVNAKNFSFMNEFFDSSF